MAVEQSRQCRKCGQVKPADAFAGNRSECRVCLKLRQRRWENENREHVNQRSREWVAANPERSRAIKERWYSVNGEAAREKHRHRYYSDIENILKESRTKYATDAEFRASRLAYAKRYRVENPERCAASYKAAKQAKPEKYRAAKYHSVLKRRARRIGLPDSWSRTQAAQSLAFFNHSCATCKTPFGLLAKSHFDHWIPLTHPDCPGTIASNMLPMCENCNLSKNARDADEWLRDKFGERAVKIARDVAAFFAAIQN